MSKVDYTEFTPADHHEAIIISLMEHIASGAPNEWAVYANGSCVGRYKDYQEANRVFDSTPSNLQSALHLYTRVGTAVLFRYKE